MKAFREILLIGIFSTALALGSWAWHPNGPDFSLAAHEIELERALAISEVLWVDARTLSEYEENHYEDALLLNEEDWENLFVAFLDRWNPNVDTIVYCSSQSCLRSHEVAERLRVELGSENVFALRGGWEALVDLEIIR